MSTDLARAIGRSVGRSLVDPSRMKLLWEIAQQCAEHPGALVEVGVFRGGTALLLREAVPDRPFFCFDTFEGHPADDRTHDHPNHWPGRFSETSLEEVEALFVEHPNPPRFVKGRFPDTLAGSGVPEQLCFVHVDVDLHDGTLAAFRLLWDRLVPGGAMVCDDYGFHDCPGARTAVRRFVEETPNAALEELPTLQCVVWKTAPARSAGGEG